MCVAVVDRGGNLVSFARMDGAPSMSAQLSPPDKGYSVVAFWSLRRAAILRQLEVEL